MGSTAVVVGAVLARIRARRSLPPVEQADAPEPYRPEEYWEARAPELVATYDRPESWPERSWMRAGVEEAVVPDLLRGSGARSVLVVGPGSGRQYAFLDPAEVSVRGIDIAPTMVRVCRERYPMVDTSEDSIVGAELRHPPADAVLSSAVLQHVPPEDIAAAASAVTQLARRLIVIRELSWLEGSSSYQWAHDYDSLFTGWDRCHHRVTDSSERFCVRLSAWRPAA